MSEITSFREKCQDMIWSDRDLERFHRFYALRSHLESYVVREAASRAVEGHSTRMLELRCRQMCEAASRGDHEAFLDADMGFHQAAAELAQVPALVEIWQVIAAHTREFAAWVHRSVFRDLSAVSQNHVRLLDAIRNGRARDAERETQAGLDSIWQIISDQPAVVGTPGDPVGRVCGYVMQNLAERLSLKLVAREVAHVSPDHLTDLFRRARGESFRSYVRRLRTNRAALLLRQTDLPVQIVAARVGYVDCSRFASYFSSRFGCTPTQWRDRKNDNA